MRNPPMWEKLSKPGNNPMTKQRIISNTRNPRSFFGDFRDPQVHIKSRRINAKIPNKDPEQPLKCVSGQCFPRVLIENLRARLPVRSKVSSKHEAEYSGGEIHYCEP